MSDDKYDDDFRQWCSIYGYEWPKEHICTVAICYNPYRDDQELRGTLAERIEKAEETRWELRTW